ncbi:MAG: hypothetical protein ACYS7Y_29590 [Planctomycetota bacterium]|jgi:hypothetical protein
MSGAFVEQVVTVFLTSDDLKEMHALARDKERNNRVGDELYFKTWFGKGCKVKFAVDQERARKAGLMR